MRTHARSVRLCQGKRQGGALHIGRGRERLQQHGAQGAPVQLRQPLGSRQAAQRGR